jgi:tetratricopeptide (TPR) repeat protein
MSKKAFVSYSRKDSDFALKYAGNLKKDFDLWLDQWDIPHLVEGDADWDRAIHNAILECSHFLIILSPQSVQSKEVLGEIRLALDEDKIIIPVLYQSCIVPRQLRRLQYIDFASSGKGPDDFSLISQTLRRLKDQEILPLDGPPFQIPAPPADFTGQEEEIEETLEYFDKGLLISSIQGLGGIGKTDLAKKLAQILKDRFPDGQIMIDLMGTTDPSLPSVEAMRKVVQLYVSAERIPKEEDEIRGLYQSVLSGKYLLLLLDNARDGEQVEPLLPPPNCAVIVTSRQDISLPGMRAIRLDEMKPGKAEELLKRIVQTSRSLKGTSDECWKDIARLCGYLPLALRLAGTFLANTRDLYPEDYAGRLRDERRRLEHIDKGGKRCGEIGVQASLHLSYSRLSAEAAAVFRMLSVFPADFDFRAEEVICQDEDREQLSELLRWNLVDYQEEAKRYRLHDLVRIFASGNQTDESRATIAERHSSYYKNLLAEADNLYLQGGAGIQAGLALFDREAANIMAGHSWSCERLQASNQAAELCMSYPDAGAYVIGLRLHPRQRIFWLQEALKAAITLKNKKMEGSHLGNLGLAYAALGDACKAIGYYEQHLAIAREIGDRSGEGNALGNLGLAYADLGDARKAIEYYEQHLAIAREIGDRRGEGNALGNLGLAYADLGDARKAIEYYEQALAIDREIGDRRSEGNALGNLGSAHYVLGDARKAIEYYEHALAIDREIGDRRGEGADLGNLGSAYADLGDARKAIDYYDQRIAIAREIGDRRGEGNALGNLGNAYAALGDARKAIEYYEQSLAILREIGNKRGEGAALGNLGSAHYVLGDTRKAIDYYEQHLAIAREIGDRRGEALRPGIWVCNMRKQEISVEPSSWCRSA